MSADPIWKYVNVRRLFIFIEEWIDEGAQWVVFEPNAEPLWDPRAPLERELPDHGVAQRRAHGHTPREAIYVKCDRTTMTQDDIDNGRLICHIGVAPVRPAESVVFRIHQTAARHGHANLMRVPVLLTGLPTGLYRLFP